MTNAKPPETVCANVEPGPCGFVCRIRARQTVKRSAEISILSSDCKQIQRLSELISTVSLSDVFKPVNKNPIFEAAKTAGCHASCLIPFAVLKSAEAALGMAVVRNAVIELSNCGDVEEP